jgi:2-oxoglutarate dehydrogenase E2 component (dihydrolipoamide succinyltransferase)
VLTEIRIPRLNANDDAYVLVAWLAGDGEPVTAGTPIVEVETSKAVDEIAAESDGFLHQLVRVGASIVPGQAVATIGETVATNGVVTALGAGPTDVGPTDGAGQTITAPARARMNELGVTEAQVARLDARIVRRADVDALAPEFSDGPSAAGPFSPQQPVEDTAGSYPLSKEQRAVGVAVRRSQQSVPAAYTVVRMDVGAALARAAGLVREVRRPVGLAELVIEAVAGQHRAYPLFFGRLDDSGATVHLADAPHVGVTVDLGEGLYVPVVHHAAGQSIGAIARRLMDFRLAALEDSFRSADLDGANITVTLHTEADVVLAVPFVFPGQVCALAVTAPRTELVLDEQGQVGRRTVTDIGLAYDHRVVNGRDAALFLNALKEALR